MKLLKPELVRHEMSVLQRHFKDKRDYVLKRLEGMGLEVVVSWNFRNSVGKAVDIGTDIREIVYS